jgi:hypothetical protein
MIWMTAVASGRRRGYTALMSHRAIIWLSYPGAPPNLCKFRITPRTKLRKNQEHTGISRPIGRSKRFQLLMRARRFTRIDHVGKVFHLMQQIQKETP